MKHEIDLKKYTIRTDLIVDLLGEIEDNEGVEVKKEKEGQVETTYVEITKEENALHKKVGHYSTISFEDVTDSKNRKEVEEAFVKAFRTILDQEKIQEKQTALVVGLGNMDSTPDALGPKVAKQVLVTRYLFEIDGVTPEEGYRNVASFIPGVMANTGYESGDMIQSLIQTFHPDFLIVIDALASSAISRVHRTIQITDTGIYPGSGVGNKRKELSKELLGIPVISVGVPTVIDAIVLVSDTIQYLFQHFSYHKDFYHKTKLAPITSIDTQSYEDHLSYEEKEKLLGQVGHLSEEELQELIFEVLTPIGYHMVVTPKEVDFVIEKLSVILANGLNRVLHSSFDNSRF